MHQNSQVAIFLAHPSTFNLTISSRQLEDISEESKRLLNSPGANWDVKQIGGPDKDQTQVDTTVQEVPQKNHVDEHDKAQQMPSTTQDKNSAQQEREGDTLDESESYKTDQIIDVIIDHEKQKSKHTVKTQRSRRSADKDDRVSESHGVAGVADEVVDDALSKHSSRLGKGHGRIETEVRKLKSFSSIEALRDEKHITSRDEPGKTSRRYSKKMDRCLDRCYRRLEAEDRMLESYSSIEAQRDEKHVTSRDPKKKYRGHRRIEPGDREIESYSSKEALRDEKHLNYATAYGGTRPKRSTKMDRGPRVPDTESESRTDDLQRYEKMWDQPDDYDSTYRKHLREKDISRGRHGLQYTEPESYPADKQFDMLTDRDEFDDPEALRRRKQLDQGAYGRAHLQYMREMDGSRRRRPKQPRKTARGPEELGIEDDNGYYKGMADFEDAQRDKKMTDYGMEYDRRQSKYSKRMRSRERPQLDGIDSQYETMISDPIFVSDKQLDYEAEYGPGYLKYSKEAEESFMTSDVETGTTDNLEKHLRSLITYSRRHPEYCEQIERVLRLSQIEDDGFSDQRMADHPTISLDGYLDSNLEESLSRQSVKKTISIASNETEVIQTEYPVCSLTSDGNLHRISKIKVTSWISKEDTTIEVCESESQMGRYIQVSLSEQF